MKSLFARAVTYGLIVLLAALSALPATAPQALRDKMPDWYLANAFTLGLDLRGGSHLLLALDTEGLLAGDEAQAMTRPEQDALVKDAIDLTLEVLRRRLDESGMVEPSITRQGRDSIAVQLPGVTDPARIRELLGTTAHMQFQWLARDSDANVEIVRGTGPGESFRLERRIAMEGSHVRDARMAFRQETGQPIVTFRLDNEGARVFGELTRSNVGRALAVVLDGRVITAPVIQTPILGGSGEISGSFTAVEATDLAVLLRAGALPADLSVIEERTVGPNLGSDAIAMGLTTGIIGALLVLAFMVAVYGQWGLIAWLGLAVNALLIFGVLSLLRATLTLPGIAGIILVLGMAVDANILINERIREETRRGKTAWVALDAGFRRAFGTILDSNITTLIAISLLFMIGSGPVRGFAVTMGIGLLTSLFTATAITRLLMEWRVRRLRRQPLQIGGLRLAERLGARFSGDGSAINFMRAGAAGLIISAVLSSASLVLLVTPGLNYGIDFSGGALIELRADTAIADLRSALAAAGHADASLQAAGSDGDYQIRLPMPAEGASATAGNVLDSLRAAVAAVAPDADFGRAEMVGPRVSGDFADLSILAILCAGVGMLAYLWLRFEHHFALAAVLTIGLDLTKTIGFFVLTGIEFNLTAVAALLALIGYSINDKVVVFDRIRENLRLRPEQPLLELLNSSITATLSRTVLTSLSTLIALLPMAIAGGDAVASFALPMLFGIVVGTSSSIFIAAPIVLHLGRRRAARGLPQLAVPAAATGDGDPMAT
jgi:SecD/SecF fusion protein